MEPAMERDVQHHMAVMGEAIGRCQNLLHQKYTQEADLRDGQGMLAFAHSDAERGLLGVRREE